MPAKIDIVPVERIERAIILVRGQKVLLDRDLATLYSVETRVLNQAVRRNLIRFPADFMFELDRHEIGRISQLVTSSSSLKFSKSVHVFTEQGVAMLSSVLNSPRAIQVNIEIMRAFVRLRQMLASNADLERKIVALEQRYNRKFKIVFDAIREMMSEEDAEEAPPREIGFHTIPSSTKARAERTEKTLS
jgi:hypothetical protein